MNSLLKFLKFIIKVAIVFLGAFGVYNILFWFLWEYDDGPNAYDEAYQRALLYQFEALGEEDRNPQVVVVGSSYVPFAIDSKVLSEITQMETQTLGIEASVGDIFLLEELKKNAVKGDIIVFVLGKASHLDDDFMTVSVALEGNRKLLREYWSDKSYFVNYFKSKLTWRKLYSLSMGKIVEGVRSKISTKEQAYSLASFDAKGNMISERDGNLLGGVPYNSDIISFDDLSLEKLDYINEYYQWCLDNEITLLISYQPYIDESCVNTAGEIEEFDKLVKEYIAAPVLLSQKDYMFPFEYFYNHIYHMNSKGAAEYSTILGNAVCDYINRTED